MFFAYLPFITITISKPNLEKTIESGECHGEHASGNANQRHGNEAERSGVTHKVGAA